MIIDEASMLTEEQLAAVIDGVKGVGRRSWSAIRVNFRRLVREGLSSISSPG